jgi:hypothetical protein
MSRKQSSIHLDFIAIGGSCAAGCRLTHDAVLQTMLYNSESASLLFAAALFIYAARPASSGERK